MAAQISIKVLQSKGTGKSETRSTLSNAGLTFVPRALVREIPDLTDSSGNGPYWKEDRQPITYSHAGDGVYRPDPAKIKKEKLDGSGNPGLDPAEGEWLLVVGTPDGSPVIQRITLKSKNKTLLALAGWKDVDAGSMGTAAATAATVSIFNYGKANATTGDTTLISVTTYERQEFAFLSEYEWERQGTRFIIFARNRFSSLLAKASANPGARSAMFDCEDGTRKLMVKAQSGLLTASQISPDMPHDAPEAPDFVPDGQLSILHLYEYIDKMGQDGEAPGKVKEVGIFGHSYPYGPVLWNTYDKSGDSTRRDPNDLDGRSKDWKSPGVMDSYPHLKKAFASDGFFKSWGCHFDPFADAKFRLANEKRGKGEDAEVFHTVTCPDSRYQVLENTNREFIKREFWGWVKSPSIERREYLSAAAQFLGIPCWGAPMSTESNFIKNKMVVIRTGTVYAYLQAEFGIDVKKNRDETNHFNYTSMMSATSAIPRWSSQRWRATLVKLRMPQWAEAKQIGMLALPGVFRVFDPEIASVTGWYHVAAAEKAIPGSSGHFYSFPNLAPGDCVRISAVEALFLKATHGESVGILVSADRSFHMYTRKGVDSWKPHPGGLVWKPKKFLDGMLVDDLAQPSTTTPTDLVYTDSTTEPW